jgi:hypothetical protein
MNLHSTLNRPVRALSIIATLALMASIVPAALARPSSDKSDKNGEESAKVIAHLVLPGTAVRQVFQQQRNGKNLLYLQQGAHFSVVDVTNPEQPILVERVASKDKLEEVGAGLAITVVSDSNSPSTAVPTQSIRVMDLSDSKNPRTIKTFTGVTSILPDDARKLIYITNDEGLWVLRHHQPYALPLCDSSSEIAAMPECR